MHTRGYVIYGCLIYLFFLLLTFPAHQAYSLFGKQHLNRVLSTRLSGVEGPWWSGRAEAAMVRGVRVQAVSWSLRPWYLVLGRLGVGLRGRLADGDFSGHLGVGFGKIHLKKLQMDLSLTVLNELVGRYGITVDGDLTASIDRLTLDRGRLTSSDGVVVLSRVALQSPQRTELGDFKLSMVTENNELRLNLMDNGGPLQAVVVLTLGPDGEYSYSARFKAVDKNQPTLADLISLMGQADDAGQVTISRTGTLAPLVW